MIGWVAQMKNGRRLFEKEGMHWHEIDIHVMERLWLESYERYVLERKRIPRFLEFVQFKTGSVGIGGSAQFESQCIGWTDGAHEMIYRMVPGSSVVRMEIHPRIHFHPLSFPVSLGMS